MAGSGLTRFLLELVKMRVSQLNSCADSLNMHSKDAGAPAEEEPRLYVLAAWREAPVYAEQERPALEWAETVAHIEGGVPHGPVRAGARGIR